MSRAANPEPCANCGRPVGDRRNRFCSTKCHWVSRRGSPEIWFWGRLVPNGECREWPGPYDPKGYGEIYFEGYTRAHRIAWFLTNGPIPKGAVVRHSCDNPPCANPLHLAIGSAEDNTEDRRARNRTRLSGRLGEQNHSARLTAEQVREIRRLVAAGASHRRLAPIFGVNHQSIGKIARRESWAHLD